MTTRRPYRSGQQTANGIRASAQRTQWITTSWIPQFRLQPACLRRNVRSGPPSRVAADPDHLNVQSLPVRRALFKLTGIGRQPFCLQIYINAKWCLFPVGLLEFSLSRAVCVCVMWASSGHTPHPCCEVDEFHTDAYASCRTLFQPDYSMTAWNALGDVKLSCISCFWPWSLFVNVGHFTLKSPERNKKLYFAKT